MNIRYSHIQESSLVDGPGKRTVFFVQGCEIHCPGCQNRKLWSTDGGEEVDVIQAAKVLASIAKNGQITISGGEPFRQPQALWQLVLLLKVVYHCHVIVYTGFTWERLTDKANGWFRLIDLILTHVDILVDGPFVKAQDDDTIIYRGSRNQRPIDVRKSRKAGTPIVLDWSHPEVVVDEDGNVFLPIGLTEFAYDLGDVRSTRMCGQTGG